MQGTPTHAGRPPLPNALAKKAAPNHACCTHGKRKFPIFRAKDSIFAHFDVKHTKGIWSRSFHSLYSGILCSKRKLIMQFLLQVEGSPAVQSRRINLWYYDLQGIRLDR